LRRATTPRERTRLPKPAAEAQDRFSAAEARRGREVEGGKTDSARLWQAVSRVESLIGTGHAPFCPLPPSVRTRLPATPAHFIGCFFCTACSKAQPRPCMALSGLRWHLLALRFPAR